MMRGPDLICWGGGNKEDYGAIEEEKKEIVGRAHARACVCATLHYTWHGFLKESAYMLERAWVRVCAPKGRLQPYPWQHDCALEKTMRENNHWKKPTFIVSTFKITLIASCILKTLLMLAHLCSVCCCVETIRCRFINAHVMARSWKTTIDD